MRENALSFNFVLSFNFQNKTLIQLKVQHVYDILYHQYQSRGWKYILLLSYLVILHKILDYESLHIKFDDNSGK